MEGQVVLQMKKSVKFDMIVKIDKAMNFIDNIYLHEFLLEKWGVVKWRNRRVRSQDLKRALDCSGCDERSCVFF